MSIIKAVPTRITSKLSAYGWNEYKGENPMYKRFWVRDEVAIKIDPARTMPRMYHLSVLSQQKEEHTFIHEDKLNEIIETER